MKYFVVFLVFTVLVTSFTVFDVFADSEPNNDYQKFSLGDSYIYADNIHITDISLYWSESLPYGTITFDEKISTDINIMIPKNIPRKMNLDFGTSMVVFYPDMSIVQIKETETDCFYHLRIPVNNVDEISIDTITVATGRWEPVTIDDPKCNDIYERYLETYALKSLQNVTSKPGLWPIVVEYPSSPLVQFRDGVEFEQIHCKENLSLVQKYDGSPACVKPETKQKLVERGWIIVNQKIDNNLRFDAISATNLIDANNQFALNFYSQVSDNNKNIFFSPLSISTAFAMVYEGARENTAQEIQNTFGFLEDVNKHRDGFQRILEKSDKPDSEYKFSIANALWLAREFIPHSEYVSVIKENYRSEINTVDFTKDAENTINDWVSDKTEQKIEELFAPGSLLPDTRLVITNAIYFKGSWTFPFEKDDTRSDEFITPSGDVVPIEMMHQTAFFNYYQNEQLQLVELPYRGDKMSMLILLPVNVNGISSLENSLTIDNISKWKKSLDKKKITVKIPKFSLDADYELIKILEKMGIRDAFGTANFSGISDEELFIYEAIHKSFVDVNEIGTEAAAATGIAMFQSGPYATLRADHPFIFVIQDTETGNILFMGRITDPSV